MRNGSSWMHAETPKTGLHRFNEVRIEIGLLSIFACIIQHL